MLGAIKNGFKDTIYPKICILIGYSCQLCFAQSHAIHFIWITHQNTRVSCYRLSNMYFVSHVFCMHSPSILCVLLCVHNSYAVCVCIRSFVYCLTILNMLARSNYTPFISFHPVMFFVFQLKCLYIWSALNQPPYFA